MLKKYIIVEFCENNEFYFEIYNSESVTVRPELGNNVICKGENNLIKNGILRSEYSSMRLASAELNRLRVILKLQILIKFLSKPIKVIQSKNAIIKKQAQAI